MVLKPAELTPLTALRIAELALEAGLPPDVFQVIPGKGSVVGQRLVDHPDVAKIVFTGSTEVGRRIMAGCARRVKPVTLELGGKSANVVFADATWRPPRPARRTRCSTTPARTAAPAPGSSSQRTGFDRFMELLEPAVRGRGRGRPGRGGHRDGAADQRGAPGRGWPATSGPDAGSRSAGRAPDGPGFWFPPTVLIPDDPTDRVLHEEIFGPVVAVVPFDDEADAVRIANDSEFGLSGSIWTRDVGRALRVSRAIEAGNLSVNSHSSVRYWTPFGGYKSSGLGRELGPDAPLAFTETKNVFLATE